MTDLRELQRKVHETAIEKGWWDWTAADRQLPELIALMHSELSEALEAWRSRKEPFYEEDGKPEGWATELADCIIRILDTCERHGVDIEEILTVKALYNVSRPYRHGGKRA